jgi:L,D-peptidoglycan transpeptidase YkuD (ErfK/YbiS/YcfS/YnhG family)
VSTADHLAGGPGGIRRIGAVLAGLGTVLPLLVAGCAAPSASPAHARPGVPVTPVESAMITGPAAGSATGPVAGSAAGPASRPAVGPGVKRGQPLPTGVPEPPAGSDQLVTVLVPATTSTAGTLRAWQRAPGGGWTTVLGPIRVRVGADGVGTASEGVNRTPRGTFTLDQAFGRQPNPGTALPYRKVGDSDWWVSDPKSPAYNTYRGCAPGSCGFDESAGENLGRAGPSYDYAMVIGYNTAPVRAGAGSAFFVHVDAGAKSAGCVEVPRASVLALLRWLAPGQHPRITIGLG